MNRKFHAHAAGLKHGCHLRQRRFQTVACPLAPAADLQVQIEKINDDLAFASLCTRRFAAAARAAAASGLAWFRLFLCHNNPHSL